MMKKLISQPYFWALVAVILVGAFLRFYNFEPWLHFELDQSRDALVIDEGYKGSFLDMPLLGPRAAGAFLRLGPAFYYLQYVSGLIFGQDPAGIAYFVPIFGTLSIAFVYFFLRRGFPRFESILLTLLFSVSLYAVMYSRFAWNPNLLVFFVTSGLYALLRSVGEKERYPGRWFIAAIALLALATQFHFMAFLSMPIITVLFLLIKRPRFSWKAWVGALVAVLFLYLPMVLNEYKAGFTNTQQFFGAVTEKSEKEDRNILEKAVRNVTEYSQHSVVILTGFEGSTIPAVIIQKDEIGTVCRDKCDDGKWYGMTALALFLLSLMAVARARFRSRTNNEKDFYDLALIWFGVSFLIFLPLSYAVAPRFYLLVTPLFFIFLGILVQTTTEKLSLRNARVVFAVVIILLVVCNGNFITKRFSEMKRAMTEQVNSAPDRILKEQIRVTLEQQEMIADFFKSRQEATGYPIYMHSDPQYRRSLKYVMDMKGVQNEVLSLTNIYREGEYYLVLRYRDDYESAIRKYREPYEIGEFKSFGTLMMIQLLPKPESFAGDRQVFEEEEVKNDTPSEAPRYTWREFLEGDDQGLKEEGTEEGEDLEN